MGDARKQIQEAIAIRDKDTVEKLLDGGLDVNSNLGSGLRPLHCAINANDRNMITFLDSKGADLNIRMGDGSTPLHYVVKEWNPGDTSADKVKIIELLVRLGADVNATNAQAASPLDLAVAANQHTLAASLRRYGGKEGPGAASLPKEPPDKTLRKLLGGLGEGDTRDAIKEIMILFEAEDEEGLKKLANFLSGRVARLPALPACEVLLEVGRYCTRQGDVGSANQLFQAGRPLAKGCGNQTIKDQFSSFARFRGVKRDSGGGGGGMGKIIAGVLALVVVGGGAAYMFMGKKDPGPDVSGTPGPVASVTPTTPKTPGPVTSPTTTPPEKVEGVEGHLGAAEKALEGKDYNEALRQGGMALDAGAQGELREKTLRVMGQAYLGDGNFKGAREVYKELKDEDQLAEVERQVNLRKVDEFLNQAKRFSRSREADALVAVEEAVKLLEANEGDNARMAQALNLKGEIALKTGNFGAAKEAMEKAVELAPDEDDYKASLANLRQAESSRISIEQLDSKPFRFPRAREGENKRSTFYIATESANTKLGGGGEFWFSGRSVNYTIRNNDGGKEAPPSINVTLKQGRTEWTIVLSGKKNEPITSGEHRKDIKVSLNGVDLDKGMFAIHEMVLTGKVITRFAMDFYGRDDRGKPVFGRVRHQTKY